jgi:hypothetical protein
MKTGDSSVKRVVLSAPHSVYTTFGGDAVTGKADIEYVLDVSMKKPDSPLPFFDHRQVSCSDWLSKL